MLTRCDGCRWSDYKHVYDVIDKSYYECHLNPPTPVVVNNKILFVQPIVNPDDGCSKFKQNTGE